MEMRMYQNLRRATLAMGAGLVTTSAASAAIIDFTVSNGDLAVDVTLSDVLDGVQVDLAVDESVTGNYADLRGAFFDVDDEALLSNLTVVGDDVTDFDFRGSVSNLGNGANVNPDSFHAGVEIGSQGAGENFIPSTSFVLGGDGLDTSDFLGQAFAIRATSVGSDPTGNANGGSVKLIGTVPIPEPASLALAALPGLLLCRRTRR